MRITHLPLALVLLAPGALAQDDAAAMAMPDPKTEAHDALKPFVGTWNLTVKITDGGQTMEMPGTETFELVCGGLWLKSSVVSSFMGQPFYGVSLRGYNPMTKTYEEIWIDSMTPGAAKSSLTYDAKTRTWNAKLVAGHGPERSTAVWKDDDTLIDTGYQKGPDGKESPVMEITRKRADKAAAQKTEPASASAQKSGADKAAAKDAAQQELDRHLGKWNVVMTMTMPTPDGSKSEDKGTETCVTLWDGGPMWTDFNTTFMGGAFEGHALAGYDPVTKKVTTYWIDSMSPFMTVLTGAYDAKTSTLSASGKCIDATGGEATMTESTSWKDENTRVNEMSMTGAAGTMKWTITSTRAK